MFSPGMKLGGGLSLIKCRQKIILMFVLVLLSMVPFGPAFGADEAENRIELLSIDESPQGPIVKIKTLEPVGFRYTVYDSQDPKRIIVDFRDMSMGEDVSESISVDFGPVSEIRTSAFDLTSGKLSRVEILLTDSVDYTVSLDGELFQVALTAPSVSASTVAEPDEAGRGIATTEVAEGEIVGQKEPLVAQPKESEAISVNVASKDKSESEEQTDGKPASRVKELIVQDSLAKIVTNGTVGKYRYFILTGPTRLVVDVYGVKPQFKNRAFDASNGFKRIRIGVYEDKTRFVFDASEVQIADFVVDTADSTLLVDWSGTAQVSADLMKHKTPDAPIAVNDVAFSLDNGKSLLTISLSAEGQIVEPILEGNLVRFGVENATISRSLRRIIDASVFPSAVRIVTPYTVQVKDRQNVLFAVELKGPVDYELKQDKAKLILIVSNGPFAEEPFVDEEKQEVVVPERIAAPAPAARQVTAAGERTEEVEPEAEFEMTGREEDLQQGFAERKVEIYDGDYTGQKISLVFDNADIKNVLQLIADVSNLNIIATEEVKGTLTIRLIDVPWDQALDIVLDIKGLGMIKAGNVVRILPKDKIREMERADLQAAQTREELEPLVTEVISVSYTDLGSVTGPAQNILSNRGKITEDARNKQLIVTDVPSRVVEIRKLVSILDTPEKQVVIEARIVEASSNFSRDLGVSWGLSYDANGTNGAWEADEFNLGLGGSFVIPPPSQGSVGSAGLATGITFGRVGIDSTTLDLRISALESSGYGKVISTPRVTTLNGKQASISQGTKIPYQSVGDEGTTTEFVDAVLSLDVTPVINPDESIILDISAANSNVGSTVPTGSGSAPSVDTKEATTQVLVHNGETTVIGGIFVEDEDFAETGVPLLRSIPILGHLFKSTTKTSTRNELLIFITPRIVDSVN